MHNFLWVSNTILKFRKHLRKHPDTLTEGPTEGWAKQTIFIGPFRLVPGGQIKQNQWIYKVLLDFRTPQSNRDCLKKRLRCK